jgi:hypothetical protein
LAGVEIEGWVDPGLPGRDADALGRQVATALARRMPEAGSPDLDKPRGPADTPALSAAAGPESMAVSKSRRG